MNNFDFEPERFMAPAAAYRKEIEEFQGTLILNPQQFKYLEAVAYLKRLASEMFGDKVEVSLPQRAPRVRYCQNQPDINTGRDAGLLKCSARWTLSAFIQMREMI